LEAFQDETDANQACNKLIKAYEKGIKKLSKTFTPSRRNNPIKPWVTPALLCSINTKNKLYAKYIRNKILLNENKYKMYRNMLCNVLRDAKRLYYKRAFQDSKGDGKKHGSI